MARKTQKNKKPKDNSQRKDPKLQVKQEAPVSVADVENSTSQAEFDELKAKLLVQLMADIDSLENEKKSAEAAATTAKEALATITAKREELTAERNEVQKTLGTVQTQLNEAEAAVEAAQKRKTEILDGAETEKLKILKEAAEDARHAMREQVESLSSQLKDILNKEKALHENQMQLERDKQELEFEREELADLIEYNNKRKEKFAAANPARLEELIQELEEEREKYKALSKRHTEQTQRFAEFQVIVEQIKVEMGSSTDSKKSITLGTLLSTLKQLKEDYERLVAHHTEFKDDASVQPLKEKAGKYDKLLAQFEQLQRNRNTLYEQVTAFARTQKELEIIRQEVDATNALNEHLLKELESHKTALESRTGDTCPALSKVDTEAETAEFKRDIQARIQQTALTSLKDIVAHVRNYAGSRADKERLFYTEDDIRAFLSGLAVSRLMILQGMSGTGKSSLPRIFSEAISGFNRLIPVESSWRDRNELLGYYNDFNKKFNAKSFTIELYRSGKDRSQEIPTFIVLDEMNLARIEYYFSDFLAILQEPDSDKWLIELVAEDMRTLPMELDIEVKKKMSMDNKGIYAIWEKIEKSRRGELAQETTDDEKTRLSEYLQRLGLLIGAKDLIDGRKIRVTDNIWFIGTANRDESTFEISDKVYDRAQVVSLNRKGVDEKNYASVNARFISADALNSLFESAQLSVKDRAEVERRLQEIDNSLMTEFDVSFGNRIVMQTMKFVAVFVAAGGRLETALDYQISTKILRKIITTDDGEALLELQELLTEKDYPESYRLIAKRIKELR